MFKYDKNNIEDLIAKFSGKSIKSIYSVKVYNTSYVENHFGNIDFYSPEYSSWEYTFSFFDADEICRENRVRGRNFYIKEAIFLCIELCEGELFLLNDFSNMDYVKYVLREFVGKSEVTFDNIVFFMFMVSAFKNKNMICLYTKNTVDNVEQVDSCKKLKNYSSNFKSGVMEWDIEEVIYNGKCCLIAAILNTLLTQR